MFCKRCGTELDNSAVFCPQCGAKIKYMRKHNDSVKKFYLCFSLRLLYRVFFSRLIFSLFIRAISRVHRMETTSMELVFLKQAGITGICHYL